VTPTFADDWLTVYQGDALAVLRTLPTASIDCVVTSPPYWGHRDYECEGQLGLEMRPEQYVDALVDVFREVRRVVTPRGTVWLNLGDAYADRANKRSDGASFRRDRADVVPAKRRSTGGRYGLKAKDMIGLPWRVAFALQADGWYLRSDIIWAKPNPMPASYKDRPTTSHEYVFLLTRSPR
jgi:DNA modification methylase